MAQEFATMFHSAPCTPKAKSANPTTRVLRDAANARCSPASTSRPMRIVQVALIRAMIRSPRNAPSTPPVAMQVKSRP
ncbi:hypothetical protein NKG94_13195 [Micromonospora sp. M12]